MWLKIKRAGSVALVMFVFLTLTVLMWAFQTVEKIVNRSKNRSDKSQGPPCA